MLHNSICGNDKIDSIELSSRINLINRHSRTRKEFVCCVAAIGNEIGKKCRIEGFFTRVFAFSFIDYLWFRVIDGSPGWNFYWNLRAPVCECQREFRARRVLCTDRLSAAQLVTTKRQIVVSDIAELSRNGNKVSRLIFIFFLLFLSGYFMTVRRTLRCRLDVIFNSLHTKCIKILSSLFLRHLLRLWKKVEIAIRCRYF